MMKCNMGKTDRIIRIAVGVAILAVGYFYESAWGLLGLIFLATAAMAWCPLYLPLNLSTCKMGETKDGDACCSGGACHEKKQAHSGHDHSHGSCQGHSQEKMHGGCCDHRH